MIRRYGTANPKSFRVRRRAAWQRNRRSLEGVGGYFLMCMKKRRCLPARSVDRAWSPVKRPTSMGSGLPHRWQKNLLKMMIPRTAKMSRGHSAFLLTTKLLRVMLKSPMGQTGVAKYGRRLATSPEGGGAYGARYDYIDLSQMVDHPHRKTQKPPLGQVTVSKAFVLADT